MTTYTIQGHSNETITAKFAATSFTLDGSTSLDLSHYEIESDIVDLKTGDGFTAYHQ